MIRGMATPRRLVGCLALLGALLARAAVTPARAQLPPPSSAISQLASQSSDGHGVVVTWTVGGSALFVDGFILFRRSAADPPGSSVVIKTFGRDARAYTDYGVGNQIVIWCYQIVATYQGAYAFTAREICTAFVPGVPGPARTALNAGCGAYYQTLPAGTPMFAVALHFQPKSAVISIWRYNPLLQRQESGYFADPATPVDFTTLPAGGEFQEVCLGALATYQ
jgi:hypothetical protein